MSYGGVAAAVAVSNERQQAYRDGIKSAIHGMERNAAAIDPRFSAHKDRWLDGYDDLINGKVFSRWQPRKKSSTWDRVLFVAFVIGFIVVMSIVE
ncbi:hypothetical protein [Alteromonas macleodii]|uniref:Uncharacterized protein n=1 Tax=Alteromonas macleodii TaxID=28108 RepID=A0AB36FKL2_ALTMA|nr:hypothetical protein [Alteromonas macleodii]OES24478.1 hypothetical protein BFV95_4745 [Alteromonas macleodii]OES25535.1 hypothetical protein BFV94_4388 [Alteromonas macleodii]OES25836.1 hypothetical protein BFV93_4299 [Alteromonas macleodii]OES38642.1 hypothetical protein BFV96_4753 [Alteromonas macleodii]